jgi:DNA-binding NarL/FixJ family response regulator
MRTILADREATVRRALRDLLQHDLGMDVVGEADTAGRLAGQVRAQRPDLLVVDWELVAEPPAATLAALRRACPGLHIIALSLRPEARQAALSAGADAFVSKVEAPDHLIQAVRAARARRRGGGVRPGYGRAADRVNQPARQRPDKPSPDDAPPQTTRPALQCGARGTRARRPPADIMTHRPAVTHSRRHDHDHTCTR